jgi:heme/copper-type cytochrome/quinol oxidase subunit 1
MIGCSSLVSSINILATCYYARRANGYGGSLHNPYAIGMLVTSGMLVFFVPVLAASITMVLTDRSLNTSFFDLAAGGDSVIY